MRQPCGGHRCRCLDRAGSPRCTPGPRRPQVGAFFDFDGTLIHGYSGRDFYLTGAHRPGRSARGAPHHGPRAARRGDRRRLREAHEGRPLRPRRPPRGRRPRGGRAGLRQAAGRPGLPRGLAAGAGPPPDGPHGRAGLVGHPFPARGRGPHARHRPRAQHRAGGGRGRHPHRPRRRPDPVAGRQGEGRARVRRGARHRSRGQLRLLQRQRGHRLPQPGRPPGAATPEEGLREHATRTAGRCWTSAAAGCPARARSCGRSLPVAAS